MAGEPEAFWSLPLPVADSLPVLLLPDLLLPESGWTAVEGAGGAEVAPPISR